jgi:uncharacterized membrane protein
MSETYEQKWPTWVVIIAILILAIPLIWMLSVFMDILAAMSIGGIFIVVAIIGLFIWLNGRVDDRRRSEA